MATTAYKNARKKAYTKGHLLLEIDLVGTGVTYSAYKTIYMSDKYLTVDGVYYEGTVLDFGGMDVSLPSNEGISSTNDFSISLAQSRLQFMEADTKFSDLFNDYYFAGSVCRVYQWFDELTAKSDAELIFTGICKQPQYNDSEVAFDIEEDTSFYTDIPNRIISLDNFANAPEESIGLPIPIVYGDDWTIDSFVPTKACLTPCIKTNRLSSTFYIAEHECVDAIPLLLDVKIYLEDIGHYALLQGSWDDTNDADGFRFSFDDEIFYDLNMFPTIRGSRYACLTTDYSNAIDGSLSTSVTLTSKETLYLKFEKMTRIGVLEHESNSALNISAYISDVTGSSPYGTIKYYNSGFNGGAGAFCSTGVDITTSGLTAFDITDDKSAKGVEAAGTTDEWTFEGIGALEIGVTVASGCGFKINRLYMDFQNVTMQYTKMPRHLKIKKSR